MSAYLMKICSIFTRVRWLTFFIYEVKMELKYMALMSRLMVASPAFIHTSTKEPSIKDRFFLGIKQTSYQETNQAVFGTKLVKWVRSGNEGVFMSAPNY